MGKKTPLLIDVDRRYVLIVLPSISAWEESVEDDLRTADLSAAEQIERSLRKLERKLPGRPLRAISYQLYNHRGDEEDIRSWLQKSNIPTSRTRAGVHYAKIGDSGSPALRAELGISHLVGVELSDDRRTWGQGRGITSAVVQLGPGLLPYLLHDLALDITMFHAWPGLERSMRGTRDSIAFSRKKVEQLRARGITDCFYGPIAEETEYISFAAAARGPDGIDFDLFLDLWTEFIEEWARIRSIPVTLLNAMPTVTDEIAHSAGRIAKQISPRWVTRSVERLAPGPYRLLIARKRPAQEDVRNALAQFFGRKHYRQNMVRIVREQDYTPARVPLIFRPYIVAIRFLVPELHDKSEDV